MSVFRSDIHIGRHEAIADEFENAEISRGLSKVAYGGLRLLFAGAKLQAGDDTKAKIREIVAGQDKEGRQQRLILAVNHTSNADPFVLAASIRRQEFMRKVMAHGSIAAKASLFKYKPVAWALQKLGAFPAFRTKNDNAEYASEDHKKATHKDAAVSTGRVALSRLSRGDVVAMHAEKGGRNKQYPKEVREFEKGFGHVAVTAAAEFDTTIVPVGIVYRGKRFYHKLFPTVVYGEAINVNETIAPYEEMFVDETERYNAQVQAVLAIGRIGLQDTVRDADQFAFAK